MSSHFELTLDTTPPAITLKAGTIDRDGRLLLPYTLTEPRVASATIGGAPMEIQAGLLTLRDAPRNGLVALSLIDDVDNARVLVMPYQVAGFVGRLAAGAVGLLRAGWPGRIGRGERGTTGRISRGKEGGIT